MQLSFLLCYLSTCLRTLQQPIFPAKMVASPDCRISLSAPSCLRGSSGYTRHIKLGSFCNGELMGKKLNLAQLRSSSTNSSQKRIQMSLNSVAGESKVKNVSTLVLLLLISFDLLFTSPTSRYKKLSLRKEIQRQ